MDFKSIPFFLGDVIARHSAGVEASIPTASARYNGHRYYATDTQVEFYCDGSNWLPILDGMGPANAFNSAGQFVFETMPRALGGGFSTANALATGVCLASGVWIPKGVVLSKLAAWVGTAGTQGTTSGQHSYIALYDDTGALLCYTADGGATNRTANTEFELAIAFNAAGGAITTYTTTRSQVYQISVCWALGVGGSPAVPVLRGFNTNLANLSGGSAGGGRTGMRPMARTHGSGVTFPPPSTIASPTNVAAGFWGAGIV